MSLLIIIDRKKHIDTSQSIFQNKEAITSLQKPCYDNIGKRLGYTRKAKPFACTIQNRT